MKKLAIGLAAAVVYFWAFRASEVSPRKIIESLPHIADFFSRMYPPDQEVLVTSLRSVLETGEMALIGTTFGAIISLPLGIMAARNVAPLWLQVAARGILNAIRTIPSIVWALMFVAAVGLGPFPGVLALTMYSVGYLAKFYYEAVEAIEPGPCEALACTGAGKVQVFQYGVMPQVMPLVIGYTLYIFEYNIRAAAILGVVGAGGVGFYIQLYLRNFQYQKAATVLIVLFVVVTMVDWLSSRIRARFV